MPRGKKVPKETRPAAPAFGFPRYRLSVRPAAKLACGSDNAAGPLRPDSPPLGVAEGKENRHQPNIRRRVASADFFKQQLSARRRHCSLSS